MGQTFEYLKMALQNIRANKGRSLLTMLGIIIGISSVITIMSVGAGFKNEMNKQLDSIAGGQIYLYLSDEGQKREEYMTEDDFAQIESKMVTKSITQAQKRVEGYNYDVRKQLLDYDDVLRKQREIMYEQRNFVLENEDVHGIVRDMIDRVIENVVNANVDTSKREDNVDYDGIRQGLEVLGVAAEDNIKVENLRGKDADETAKYCSDYIFQLYDDKISDIRDEFKQFEKTIVLRNMDRNWIEHIDMMDKLRNGIHLRAYAQNNPLQAYIEEGYEMFEEMQARIAREVVFFAMKVQIERKEA